MDLDYQKINQLALSRCPDLLSTLLPGGQLRGKEYVTSNLSGGNGGSLKVNILEGIWKDFATGDGGRDIISLVAAIKGLTQNEAAYLLGEMTGIRIDSLSDANLSATKRKSKLHAITPVPPHAPAPLRVHYRLGKPTSVFTYKNCDGKVLQYVYRFNSHETVSKEGGKAKKEFCPLIWTTQGWRWQALPVPRPLYGLEKLVNSPADTLIIVTEGEGKADELQTTLGEEAVVLSINGAATGVKNLDLAPLINKRVLYWPDADKPGISAAVEFCKKGLNIGNLQISVLDPPEGFPQGWDAGDAVASGWTSRQFQDFFCKHRLDVPSFLASTQMRWHIDSSPLRVCVMPPINQAAFKGVFFLFLSAPSWTLCGVFQPRAECR